MDFKQIQELIRMINKSNIGEIIIEEKGFKLTLKQKQEAVQQFLSSPAPVYSQAPAALPVSATAAAGSSASTEKPKTSPEVASNLITIKSPMIGTFYRSQSPDKPVFVNIGDMIEPGQVVCIIEAMKLFNEIESEVKGKIVKVLADDASPVEYDQPLFLVEPA
jgi:acetyl-CoA carboxylase biotin carboxyl carrier protein